MLHNIFQVFQPPTDALCVSLRPKSITPVSCSKSIKS